MRISLPVGLKHSKSVVVTPALSVPALAASLSGFADMPEVFATAKMIAFFELACIEAMQPYLEASQRSVGTYVDVSHCAATPIGMQVTANIEVLTIDGPRIRFRVECRDEKELIGEGEHDRAVVDLPRFVARLERKRRHLDRA